MNSNPNTYKGTNAIFKLGKTKNKKPKHYTYLRSYFSPNKFRNLLGGGRGRRREGFLPHSYCWSENSLKRKSKKTLSILLDPE